MLISTILLNWNRSVLLEQTLRSYAETVTAPFELFVIDNDSSDDSRKIIEEAHKYIADMQLLFLDENIGGEAYNFYVLIGYPASWSSSARTIMFTAKAGPSMSGMPSACFPILASFRC